MISSPIPPNTGGAGPDPPPPIKNLSFVQHNCLGSWNVFLSLFNSLRCAASPPTVVLLQDPPFARNKLPHFAGFKVFAPPLPIGTAPKVACYVNISFGNSYPILPVFYDRPDIMALDVFTSGGLFNSSHTQLRVVNAYSTNGSSFRLRTVPPDLLFQEFSFPCLIMGDLNLHHSLPDPLRVLSRTEHLVSTPYFERAADLSYSLLNDPGVYTRFPFDDSSRPSVLDLAFANSPLAPYVLSWATDLPSTGSDHIPINVSLSSPLLKPPPAAPDWDRTKWSAATPMLKSLDIPDPPPLPTAASLAAWFDRHPTSLTAMLNTHTPLKRPSLQAKPWWSSKLSHLRQSYHRLARAHRRSPSESSAGDLKAAKNLYFKSIKKAKTEHWNIFLSRVNTSTVWTAKRLAYGKPPDRFPAFAGNPSPEEINHSLLQHFFPSKEPTLTPSILRPYKDVAPVSQEEIKLALSRSSNTSAAGPDHIPYGVWKKVNAMNPTLLSTLLSPLLLYGFHPPSLKRANGIVLSKPGKPDYSTPASFRVIVLLETVSKILERIVAMRLAPLARTVGLLNRNQCGSLAGLSTFDACAALTHEVRTLQRPRLKASTLFLDIKGGFDNISSSVLASLLRSRGIPYYLVSWVKSFLSHRMCRLIFQGSPFVFSPVEVGTPQGSPVSPLLFVIYVFVLHLPIPRGIMFSYVDDFTITVGSSSYRRNCQIFQHYYCTLKRKAARIGVSFSVPKTELRHWRTPGDWGQVSPTPVSLDGLLFHPSKTVRWLGYWFTPSIETSVHFGKRLALAQGAFSIVRQLSPPGKGLPPYINRKLAVGLILPILTYGADLFSPNTAMLKKLNVFWNRVLRWVTNCFYSTPTSILPCEACIPPLLALLLQKRRMAALRMACCSPTINPASARLPPSFPNHSSLRAQDSLRPMLAGLRGSYIPLPWDQARKKTITRTHLPIDALCHLLSPLLPDVPAFPLAQGHLLPAGDLPPEAPSLGQSYSAVKFRAKSYLLRDWEQLDPPPASYPYPLTTIPHPFMGLDRFTSGRIHQMRAGKSYLAAHPNWGDVSPDTTCPRCGQEEESLEHAVLICPTRAVPRLRYIPNVDSVGPASSIWASLDAVLGLARFINVTGTAFPPTMPPRWEQSPTPPSNAPDPP